MADQAILVHVLLLLATFDCSCARLTGPLVIEALNEDSRSRRERECFQLMVPVAAHGGACRKTYRWRRPDSVELRYRSGPRLDFADVKNVEATKKAPEVNI